MILTISLSLSIPVVALFGIDNPGLYNIAKANTHSDMNTYIALATVQSHARRMMLSYARWSMQWLGRLGVMATPIYLPVAGNGTTLFKYLLHLQSLLLHCVCM